MESTIIDKLYKALQPSHIETVNESYMHNVPPGSETHFKVLVVSEEFNGLPLIKVRFLSFLDQYVCVYQLLCSTKLEQ